MMVSEPMPQPVTFTKDTGAPANEVAALTAAIAAASLQLAVHSERMARLEKAMELQAREYERRLKILNHENARVAVVLSGSVTAAKFEDYVISQRQALQLALGAASEKTEAASARNAERLSELADRVLRIEADERNRDRTEIRGEQVSDIRSSRVTQWQLYAMGVVITFVIIAINLYTSARK